MARTRPSIATQLRHKEKKRKTEISGKCMGRARGSIACNRLSMHLTERNIKTTALSTVSEQRPADLRSTNTAIYAIDPVLRLQIHISSVGDQ